MVWTSLPMVFSLFSFSVFRSFLRFYFPVIFKRSLPAGLPFLLSRHSCGCRSLRLVHSIRLPVASFSVLFVNLWLTILLELFCFPVLIPIGSWKSASSSGISNARVHRILSLSKTSCSFWFSYRSSFAFFLSVCWFFLDFKSVFRVIVLNEGLLWHWQNIRFYSSYDRFSCLVPDEKGKLFWDSGSGEINCTLECTSFFDIPLVWRFVLNSVSLLLNSLYPRPCPLSIYFPIFRTL